MKEKYDDIIGLPHHVSSDYVPMSRENRAAQFSPFAALTEYGAEIKETARLTSRRIEISESDIEILNSKLKILSENVVSSPEITVTFFQEDKKKVGGTYSTITSHIKKIDLYQHALILADRNIIPINDVVDIKSKLFDRLFMVDDFE